MFITFAFGYDVAQILRALDFLTAGQLQAGEIVTKSADDDGAPCEEVVEQAVFFWDEFAITYRRGKMFRVGRLKDPKEPYIYPEITDPERRQAFIDAGRDPVERKINYKDKPVTLNDTFGFFQMSFIKAYKGSGISFTLEELKIIAEGKRRRNIMASLPMDEVIQYQKMELIILCRMMDRLRQTTNDLGLKLPHWQGAGAISMAMANKHRSKDFYPHIKTADYSPAQEWSHYCFAGGLIQMIKQGRHTGEDGSLIYGYDITSAYPSKQYLLPAMALPIEWNLNKNGSPREVIRRVEGKWIWREGAELTEDIVKMMSEYSMIEVEFSFPEKCFDRNANKLRPAPLYPLFYRCKDGSIVLPARGIGRYYRVELLAAFEWVRRMRTDMTEIQHARMIKLRGAWEFICPTINDLTPAQLDVIKTNCPSARIGEDGLVYPFQYIKDYYDQRALYPKTDTRNEILKKGICGAWGKTAQSVGGRDGKPPDSASPWYAGVVTAGTRASCILAALNAPWNIIQFATDGIQADAPLGIETYDAKGKQIKKLGGWEMDKLTRGVYIKAGIYAFANDFDKMEKDEDGLESLVSHHIFKGKSRGVSLRSVLGQDPPPPEDDPEWERPIEGEWFDYLDNMARDCYSTGRTVAVIPHQKLVTFGLAASNAELWPMCGNWIEDIRMIKMNDAGVKRDPCTDPDRAHALVITGVKINKTPKVLSAKHIPEWLDTESDAARLDMVENADLALAHDWEGMWDTGED